MAAKAISAGMPNSILVQFILDQNVTGEPFAKMRSSENTKYLEAEFPIEVEVETDENTPFLIDTKGEWTWTGDGGQMGDVHQQFLLFFTGGLTIQDQAPDMSKSGIEYQVAELRNAEGPTRFWVFRMTDQLNDDRSIRQIKAFFRSVFLAQCSQSTILLDY